MVPLGVHALLRQAASLMLRPATPPRSSRGPKRRRARSRNCIEVEVRSRHVRPTPHARASRPRASSSSDEASVLTGAKLRDSRTGRETAEPRHTDLEEDRPGPSAVATRCPHCRIAGSKLPAIFEWSFAYRNCAPITKPGTMRTRAEVSKPHGDSTRTLWLSLMATSVCSCGPANTASFSNNW